MNKKSTRGIRSSLTAVIRAFVLLGIGVLSAQAGGLTGDYKVYHNDNTDENIRYQCNSMDAYANGGGSLSGVLECNRFKLTANGHSVVAISGSVGDADVQMINDRSIVLLDHLDVANLRVEMAEGGSTSYFTVSKSAQIDLVNGARIFIRSSKKSQDAPSVHVVAVQGGQVYWCGVKLQTDRVNGGKVAEDCSWLRD